MIKTHTRQGGQWMKGQDFIDSTPRYTLIVPGEVESDMGYYCDSYDSPLRWYACVYLEMESYYPNGPKEKRVYRGCADDCRRERRIEIGPCRDVKTARIQAEQAIQRLIANKDSDSF